MDSDTLAAIGSENAPILIKLNVYEGRHSLEIRRYFYQRDARKLLPTKKGVNLSQEAFAILRNILAQQGDAIDQWLKAEGASTTHALGSTLRDRVRAVAENRLSARPYIADDASWKSSTFFEVKAEGGMDRVTYNRAHVFAEILEKLLSVLKSSADPNDRRVAAEKIQEVIRFLLIAYYRSKMLFEGADQMYPSDIFDTLELNWGAVLARCIEDTRVVR
jgi:hypothetical protein